LYQNEWGQTTGDFLMADDLNGVPKRLLLFQFRIAALLGWTTWAGFIFLGLRVPTALIGDLVLYVSLLLALGAALTAFYRTGATRARAIGFATVFLGMFSFGPLNPINFDFRQNDSLKSLFHVVHPDDEVPLRVGGSWTAPPPYNSQDFERICLCAFATLLGLLGALIAQYLYVTQPREKPTPHNC
jgi:hypothetical protein